MEIVDSTAANGTAVDPNLDEMITPKIQQLGEKVVDPAQLAQVPAPSAQAPAKYYASIWPGEKSPLPAELSDAIVAMEKALGRPIWLMIQGAGGGQNALGDISVQLADAFFEARHEIGDQCDPALLIHSNGGLGKEAYRISRLFQKQCGSFTAIVPRRAKSAATLLSLGAKEIIMGPYAELGPLDAQIMDFERELPMSALDEVKALERLHASSLEAVDQLVVALLTRTQKKIDTILPVALSYVAETVKPLVDKIDTIHFTQMSRGLKEAEEYAKRLLYQNYSTQHADHIASRLVEAYPTHGFMIDFEEASNLGITVREPEGELAEAIDAVIPYLKGTTFIGRLRKAGES